MTLKPIPILVAGDSLIDITLTKDRLMATGGGALNVASTLAGRIHLNGDDSLNEVDYLGWRPQAALECDEFNYIYDCDGVVPERVRFQEEMSTKLICSTHDKIPVFVKRESNYIFDYVNKSKFKKYKCVVISDYQKGQLPKDLYKNLISEAKKYGIPVVVDTKVGDRDFLGADLVFHKCAESLTEFPNIRHEIILKNKDGFTYYDDKFDASRNFIDFPALNKFPINDIGAGDTFVALMAHLIARSDARINREHLELCQKACANFVSKKFLTSRSSIVDGSNHYKIIDADRIGMISLLKDRSKDIVFSNGCFAKIHDGHRHLFKEIKNKYPDKILLVSLNTSDYISRNKSISINLNDNDKVSDAGNGWYKVSAYKPPWDWHDRAKALAEIPEVDLIIYQADDSPVPLIDKIRPAVLAKGLEYVGWRPWGSDIVELEGGEVFLVDKLCNENGVLSSSKNPGQSHTKRRFDLESSSLSPVLEWIP